MATALSVPTAGARTDGDKLLALFSALLDLEVSPSCSLYTNVHPTAEHAVRSFAAAHAEQTYLDEYHTRHGRCVSLCDRATNRKVVQVYVDDLPLAPHLQRRWEELCRIEPEITSRVVDRGMKLHAAALPTDEARAYLRMVAK